MTSRYIPGEYMVPADGAWSRNGDDMEAKQGLPLIDGGELAVSDPIGKEQGTTTSMEYIYVDGLGSVSLPTAVYLLNVPGIDDGVYSLGATSLPNTSDVEPPIVNQ
jgi:hypothetical protein